MKYLWSTYVQLMWLEVLQLLTFFRLQLWRGLTPPYEWMALRWLFVATSAPVLDCAFVRIGEYLFKKPDVSCFKEIYTQLRYSNPKCREDESKAKVPWKQKSDESNHGRVMGDGWRVEEEGRRNLASCQVRPLSAATRRHFGHAELRTIKASASTLPHPMIPWSQWSCLCMNLDVKRNSTLQYFWIVHCTSLCCSSQNCNMKNIEKLWVNLLPGHRNLTKHGPRLESDTNAFNMQCMQSQQAVKVVNRLFMVCSQPDSGSLWFCIFLCSYGWRATV